MNNDTQFKLHEYPFTETKGYQDCLVGGRYEIEKRAKEIERKSQMTREEAHKHVFNSCKNLEGSEVDKIIRALEALGLIKFDEPKLETLMHIHDYGNYGDIKIEEWPEGLVLWIGGIIVWKSWEKYLTPRQIFENRTKDKLTNIDISYFYGLSLNKILEAIEFYQREKNK